MDKDKIYKLLTDIFRDVFDNSDISINDETTAEDIEGWDSLTHIILIHNIEQELKISFDVAQIISIKKVGDLVSIIEKTLS